jgi:galactokinase
MGKSLQLVQEKFYELYKTQPIIVRSPGRINLIGEHTDYNDGFVMPAAINYDTIFAMAEAHDGNSEVYSVNFQQTFALDTANPSPVEAPLWANYLLGVIKQYVLKGLTVKPFKCVFGGDVPLGAGLSSSASVECGIAFAINELNGHRLEKNEMILMAQWAEHNFAGVQCGIMDQFASMMGKKDQVMVLDCRSMQYYYSPITLDEHDIVLCNSKVKHSLIDSEYNSRRSECELGVKLLQRTYPWVQSLRDVNEQMLKDHHSEIPKKVYNRCLYVVQEIARVEAASNDLKEGRLAEFGMKMYQTHHGLAHLYEVSCDELDFLVEKAIDFKNVVGARMMGGGFGGCTINLIPRTKTEQFISSVTADYRQEFGRDLACYVVSIEDGTGYYN